MTGDNRIKILFVIGDLGVGGKERQLIELIHGIPEERFLCHLLVKKHDAYYLEKIRDDLQSFSSLERNSFRVFDFLTIARHIDKVQPDIVCSWLNLTSHFTLLACLFARHPFHLMNCCIRNAPVHLSPALKFERFMYSLYKTVVANSQAGLESYGQSGKKGRYVLYNGFDLQRVPVCSQETARKSLCFARDKFIVVMVASLTPLKDHETFLKAAAECKKQRDDIQFLIVGDGTERDRLERLAEETESSSIVSFLGKRDDVEMIFRAADLSVLTSTAWFGEGISNSIIESMACGTPVIASDSPGTREVIVDNENGFIVKCGDFQGLAGKITELQDAPEIMRKVSEQARSCVASKFSIQQLIEKFCGIVDKCLA